MNVVLLKTYSEACFIVSGKILYPQRMRLYIEDLKYDDFKVELSFIPWIKTFDSLFYYLANKRNICLMLTLTIEY